MKKIISMVVLTAAFAAVGSISAWRGGWSYGWGPGWGYGPGWYGGGNFGAGVATVAALGLVPAMAAAASSDSGRSRKNEVIDLQRQQLEEQNRRIKELEAKVK